MISKNTTQKKEVGYNATCQQLFNANLGLGQLFSRVTLILLLLFFITPNASNAQETKQPSAFDNHFRIGIGVDYIKTLDFKVSPIMYQALRNNLHFGYENRLKKGIFLVNLNVFLGTLKPSDGISRKIYYEETDIYGNVKNDFLELKLMQMGVNLEIGYLPRLTKITNTKAIFYAGGSLSENLTFNPSFMSIGTINFVSLSPKVMLDYYLPNGKPIIVSLSFPVVSLVTRLPYHNAPAYPDKNNIGAFFTGNNIVKTVNHFQNAQFSAKYNWLVLKKLSVDVAYSFFWMHHYEHEHFTHVGNQVSLGINF